MVGSGILITPAPVAAAAGSAWLLCAIWALGGLYVLCGALSQAQLAVRWPDAGGDYVYLLRTYGPLPAFLCGWTSLTVGFAGSQAGLARACAKYLLAGALPEGWSLPFGEEGIALALLALLTLVNLLGVGPGVRLQAALTAAKVVLLAALAAGAVLAAGGGAAEAVPVVLPLSAVLLPVVFTYAGWNDATYVAGEVVSPARSLPLALVAGTAGVTVLYLLFNLGFWLAAGAGPAAADLPAAAAMAAVALGPGASRAVALLAAVLILGTVAACVVTGPRIGYAMASQRALPRVLARLNRFAVPSAALLLQLLLSSLFVLVGTLDQIVMWVGFAVVVFSALAVSCVLVRPEARPAYRIPLFPVPPLLYIAASLAIAGWVALADPVTAASGLAFVAAGLPVYWVCRRGE
jgi:APA family basic amino acid/polyamine antiporter